MCHFGVQLKGSCRQWKDLMLDLVVSQMESNGEGGGVGAGRQGGGGGGQLSICYRERVLIMTRGPCKLIL